MFRVFLGKTSWCEFYYTMLIKHRKIILLGIIFIFIEKNSKSIISKITVRDEKKCLSFVHDAEEL